MCGRRRPESTHATGHRKLVDFEIKGFEEELATFIFDEVLSKDGPFSIARSKKYEKQHDKDMLNRLL
jgi:hypothetical protein